MKLLILVVDRDDDLGNKVGITTPVIGRENCLKAAMAMGLKDPEESDTNSIFSGISIYDKYIESGVEAEVAVICGDINVGIKSDQTLAAQLDDVLSKVEPGSAILVSDGAEDEFIYPILASRIHIDGIKRVIVKQSRNIESFYYMIARSMQDEKVRRKFVLPIALALIVFSTFYMLTQIFNNLIFVRDVDPTIPDISLAMVFLTLGFYIIIKAYNLDEPIRAMSRDAKTAISTIPFVMLAGVIIIAGIIAAFDAIGKSQGTIEQILILTSILLWTGVFAIILLGMGRALQVYTKEGDFPWVFFPMVFSILSFGSFMYGILMLTSYLLGFSKSSVLADIFIFWAIGFFFALLGYFAYSGIKEPKTLDWHK